MANIKKIVVVSAIVGVLSFYGWQGITAAKTTNAAGKLDYDVDSVSFKEFKKSFGIKTGAVYTITLKVNNPSDQDIIISKMYLKVSFKKKDGSLAKIFNTNIPDANEINIKSNSSKIIKHDIELRALNMIGVSTNLFDYIKAKATGQKGTQELVLDVTLDSLGLTIPMQTIIKI